MKLARLSDARMHAVLRKLSAAPLPLRIAFKLKGVQSRVDEELGKYEEVRKSALEKFGKKGEDGKVIIKPDGNVELEQDQLKEFVAQMNELGQTDVDIPSLKMDELGDRVQLSVDELNLLDGILVE
jgi:hypothetical protein